MQLESESMAVSAPAAVPNIHVVLQFLQLQVRSHAVIACRQGYLPTYLPTSFLRGPGAVGQRFAQLSVTSVVSGSALEGTEKTHAGIALHPLIWLQNVLPQHSTR
jgi:hypothetical protein